MGEPKRRSREGEWQEPAGPQGEAEGSGKALHCWMMEVSGGVQRDQGRWCTAG